MAESVGCSWATYWQVCQAQYALIPKATWKSRPELGGRLERDTQGRRLSLSEGTAGHVWRSRKPIWTTDLLADMCLPRSLDAKAQGFQGGVWFAVKTDNAVYGVVEMLGPSVTRPSESLLFKIEWLGMVLGGILEDGVAQ